MAITTPTSISNEKVLLNEGAADVQVITDYLHEDMPPCTWVVNDVANNKWIKMDAANPAHSLMQSGVVGYKKRVNQTTGALKLITDNYDISEVEDKRAPIITSGFVVAKITDQSATIPILTEFGVSATAGAASALALTTGYLTGTSKGTSAAKILSGDLYCIMGIGKYKGKIYGGI